MPTPPSSPFSGEVPITQSDGYSYRLAWNLQLGQPQASILNDAPGEATVTVDTSWSLTLRNTTPGRNLPTAGNTYQIEPLNVCGGLASCSEEAITIDNLWGKVRLRRLPRTRERYGIPRRHAQRRP